jgi:hypothetical protein
VTHLITLFSLLLFPRLSYKFHVVGYGKKLLLDATVGKILVKLVQLQQKLFQSCEIIQFFGGTLMYRLYFS